MLKLLLVDDEQWVREHYSQRIDWGSAGFLLIGAASSAKEAIRMMELEPPHLVLTDITMPDVDGLELAGYVRERYPQVRIMILTTYGEFDFAQRAISIGVSGYMIKQAHASEQLLAACRKVAEDIYQEMNVAYRLELQGLQQWQSDWEERRRWLEQLLSAPSSPLPIPPGLVALDQKRGEIALLSVSWSAPEVSGAAEQVLRLQGEAGRAIERRLDGAGAVETGEGHTVAVGPWRNDRLLVFKLMPSIHSASAKLSLLHEDAWAVLDELRATTGVRGHAHIQIGKQGEAAWAELFRAGTDGLDTFFYSPVPAVSDAPAAPFAMITPVQLREWVSAVGKALHQRSAASFREAIAPLLREPSPRIRPAELIAVSYKLLDPALSDIPEAVTVRTKSLASIETWEQFNLWWEQTSAVLERAFEEHGWMSFRKEVQSMCCLIHEKYVEDIQVADLAEHVQLHPSYAGQLFKQETGEHVTDYLNRYRMKKAEELLERTTMKIYEVAEAVGIVNYRYFCKLFKDYTGLTPTEYKKKQ